MTTQHEVSPTIREPEETTLESRIGRLAVIVAKELSPGDRADLRRASPDDFGGPAFWKVAASHLTPAGLIAGAGSIRDRQEREWIVILSAIAHLEGLHAPKRPLGAALAESGFSELRLTRLLRADGMLLLNQVRQMVHFLGSKGTSTNVADIARLVLSDTRSERARVRRSIARNFYAQLSTK